MLILSVKKWLQRAEGKHIIFKISCGLGDLNDNLSGGHAFPENINSILHPLQTALEDQCMGFCLELPCCESLGNILPPNSVQNFRFREGSD
jgi:hypothetical protein